ncbi:MAG: hypothetical protein M3506_07525 [Chloroflexota bacterium]|nr:hypothetical protein [Chloroflexota bacterium]
MTRPGIVPVLLGIAILLLVAGGAYGALAAEPLDRTERWDGPRRHWVQSGDCARHYSLLPTRTARLPDFIRYGGRSYVRAEQEIAPETSLVVTGYWRRNWQLRRADKTLYVQAGSRATLTPYVLGACPS